MVGTRGGKAAGRTPSIGGRIVDLRGVVAAGIIDQAAHEHRLPIREKGRGMPIPRAGKASSRTPGAG